jgi:hypothetical protein
MECGFMETIRNQGANLYTFYSAKKIYFAQTPSKYLLMEKRETSPSTKVVSLVSRNTVLISRENGMLLFPRP